MNIFVLDPEPKIAARYHCDKHIVAMIKETAQMLSTAQRMSGNKDPRLYGITHLHHPCVKWVMGSQANYSWLLELFHELANEFILRTGKTHASHRLLKKVLEEIPEILPDIGITPFAQAMPEIYKQNDPVLAYRDFYINEKHRFARWSYPAEIPDWFTNGLAKTIKPIS